MNSVRVLVVDDELELATASKKRLEALGFTVEGMAPDAYQAIVLTQKLRPDLVLMDTQMTGPNGVQAAAVIWELYDTPVLFLTAHGEREKSLPAGAFGFLARSAQPEHLQREILKTAVEAALYNHDTFDSRTHECRFGLDLSGRILSVSKPAQELTGYSGGELIGRHFEELLAPEYRDASRYLLRRSQDDRESYEGQVDIAAKDGQRTSVGVSYRPVCLSDDIRGISIIARKKRPSLPDERLRSAGETPIPEVPLAPTDLCGKRVVSGMETQERVVTASVERFWSDDLLAVSFREQELGWRELDLPTGTLPTGLRVGDRFPMTVFYDSQRRIRNWNVDPSATVDHATQPPPHPLRPKKPRNWSDPSDVARYRTELDRLFKREPDQESDSGAES